MLQITANVGEDTGVHSMVQCGGGWDGTSALENSLPISSNMTQDCTHG